MRRPLANWTRNSRALVAVVALLSLLLAGPATAEKRIALVVGNSAYQNIARLDNPLNDATLMAETLSGLGFVLIGGRAQLISTKPPSTPTSRISGGKFRARTSRCSIMLATVYR